MKRKNKLCIATSWYADIEGDLANHPRRSLNCLDEKWLSKIWFQSIKTQIKTDFFSFLHLSRCNVLPIISKPMISQGIQINYSTVDTSQLDHRYEYHAAIVGAAVFAYYNMMDFLYVEQDCLVLGLEKIIESELTADIRYGYGEYSFLYGWAETSLLYVSFKFLKEFIGRMIASEIHTTKNPIAPEKTFHELFSGDVHPWGFGYGRKKNIDFTDPILYFQQPTYDEINQYRSEFRRRYKKTLTL